MCVPLQREICDCCLKSINIGQGITECKKCSKVVHTRCYKKSNFSNVNFSFYCSGCVVDIEVRYNPYKQIELARDENDQEEELDYDYDEIHKASHILENCTAFSVDEFNNLSNREDFKNNISTYFINIDGNYTNFDNLLLELDKYKNPFSIIGLAEINIDSNVGDVYQIPG